MRNIILLAAGIVLTITFVAFSTHIFEALYYEREFSNEMYNQGLYPIVSLVTVGVAWTGAILYYYVINSVSFSRWYHWMLAMVASSLLTSIINYIYPNSVFSVDGLNFTHRLFVFSMANALIGTVMFIIASFSIRWWSSNCRHTPIPE